MQLLDEIPMVWSSCAFIYCQHMVTSRWKPRSFTPDLRFREWLFLQHIWINQYQVCASGLARRDRAWHFFSWVMGLSSQYFTSQCPTQSYTRCASWRINLFHFLTFHLQAMYGLLVFYMIFQAVMILKGSYNVVSMKWELRNCIAFDCFSTLHRLFFLGIFM